MRKLWTIALVGALVLAGCGGDSEVADDILAPGPGANTTHGHGHDHAGQPVDATCEPSGTTVAVVASGTAFNSRCLAAPANQAFTINFDNRDNLPHNIAILESHSAATALARLEVVPGPGTQTLNVGPLRPGQYAFHCDVHPQLMSGVFVVK
ncbi:MAG TPA: cupredoxin domain-containing protein [Acidimicrobiales bacterium]|jgi:plastocyanin|nr:cupredoxin domain-containing protein [Acidimicrobiales bacterium]